MPHDIPSFFFFFNDTATTEIYTLSLHDALPICLLRGGDHAGLGVMLAGVMLGPWRGMQRSEEHTSELQSHLNLVCRLLLEKKKRKYDHLSSATSDTLKAVDHDL